MESFGRAGFDKVDAEDLRPNDCFILQIGSPVANHCGVYLGDQKFAHHAMHRLSTVDVYGGYWHKITRAVVRHRSQK